MSVEIVGELVDRARELRLRGARASDIVRHLHEEGVSQYYIHEYLQEAFCSRQFFFVQYLLPQREAGRRMPDPWLIDNAYEPFIEAARERWTNAPPYPDLLCRRDREAFRALAQKRACHVPVQAANSYAKPYRERAGFLPWPGGSLAVSRRAPPHAGLMALDPGDPALVALLASAKPPRSYDEHVADLRTAGFAVSGPEEGYVLSDARGRRFYPGYRLHGMYLEDTKANLWRAPEGEAIRRELNLRMGLPLVAQGPHDIWRFRNAHQAGSLRGPLLPVLWFDPDGNVFVYEDIEDLRREYRSSVIPWPFPEPPSSDGGGTE